MTRLNVPHSTLTIGQDSPRPGGDGEVRDCVYEKSSSEKIGGNTTP
jgi:hypothetical protein